MATTEEKKESNFAKAKKEAEARKEEMKPQEKPNHVEFKIEYGMLYLPQPTRTSPQQVINLDRVNSITPSSDPRSMGSTWLKLDGNTHQISIGVPFEVFMKAFQEDRKRMWESKK